LLPFLSEGHAKVLRHGEKAKRPKKYGNEKSCDWRFAGVPVARRRRRRAYVGGTRSILPREIGNWGGGEKKKVMEKCLSLFFWGTQRLQAWPCLKKKGERARLSVMWRQYVGVKLEEKKGGWFQQGRAPRSNFGAQRKNTAVGRKKKRPKRVKPRKKGRRNEATERGSSGRCFVKKGQVPKRTQGNEG